MSRALNDAEGPAAQRSCWEGTAFQAREEPEQKPWQLRDREGVLRGGAELDKEVFYVLVILCLFLCLFAYYMPHLLQCRPLRTEILLVGVPSAWRRV